MKSAAISDLCFAIGGGVVVIGNRTYVRYRKFSRSVVMTLIFFLSASFLGACGFSREERQQMQEISQTAKANAVNYIQEKYEFAAEAVKADVCTERDGAFAHPSITGCAVVTMEYEGKKFKVHISGEADTTQGTDDFQHDVISEDAREYFASLLGYEVYDIYLEYKDQPITGNPYSDRQERNLINELYQTGEFGSFIQRHPISTSISDCKNQDFTDFPQTNPNAAAYLEECAEECDTKVILISYRDEAAYQSGYVHTYGSGRILDFDIEQDGMYITSYIGFEKDGTECDRFEVQEYDGIFISCADQIKGDDLAVSSGQREWMDLGETKKSPVSAVYSIQREQSGEITVYIPYETFWEDWKGRRVYIQHETKDKWSQYDINLKRTKDGKYLFFTFTNFYGGGFDFAVFS